VHLRYTEQNHCQVYCSKLIANTMNADRGRLEEEFQKLKELKKKTERYAVEAKRETIVLHIASID